MICSPIELDTDGAILLRQAVQKGPLTLRLFEQILGASSGSSGPRPWN
jgi:hypothetical protein